MFWTEWITSDINISRSDKSEHYTPERAIKVFNKKANEITNDELYILKTVFTKSHLQAIYNFLKEANIDFNQAKKLYGVLQKKGIRNEKSINLDILYDLKISI